jgi:adhesin HecA-like repeat protein
VSHDVPANTPVATVLTAGGLILRAACSSAGDMTITARSTLDNARLHVSGADDNGVFYREDDDLDASSDYDVLGSGDDDVAGTIVYRSPTGTSVVTLSFLAEEYSLAGTGRCQFAGAGVVAQ